MSDIVVFEGDFVTDVCRQKQASVFLFDKEFRVPVEQLLCGKGIDYGRKLQGKNQGTLQ